MMPTNTGAPSASSPTHPQLNPTQNQILEMLGRGYPQNVVADAVGVTEGYVSQLVSLDWFAQLVQMKKFQYLQKQTALDEKYDDFEEELLDRLKKYSKLLVKPLEINKVLQTINAAKRRGVQNTDPATVTQRVLQVNLPVTIVNKFLTDSNNQVVEIRDDQDTPTALVTIANGALERLSGEIGKTQEPARLDCGTFGGRSIGEEKTGRPESFNGQTIDASSLERLAETRAAQERPAPRIPRTQHVAAEDL